jgi:hypothetical protein
MSSNPLIGTWRLLSWENRTLDGEVSHPLGEDASGYIAYTEDGYLFVAIMGAARRPFAAGDLLSESSAERPPPLRPRFPTAAGMSSREPPCSITWSSACSPDWLAVTPQRLVKIGRDLLTLSTRPLLLQGRQQTAHVLWKRVLMPHESLHRAASLPRLGSSSVSSSRAFNGSRTHVRQREQ